ncbi:hypothetical protein AVDCRST_MAG84-5269 [uncultured Microcoleus sp.]|uniref:Uncharacterized protein n=1 Tax=uncultured Microcoleus sp. TaxID=259945 RepID=A0A6J4NH52_9CYAN|nr:hypothetical protein AVDCRST_MAG84-5269 [uncultured Microcoleus sp.]
MVKKPGFFDRECVLECTENIRFSSQESAQKRGFSFPLQIPLVRLPPRLRQKQSTRRLGSLLNSWSYHAIREKSTASNNRPPAPRRSRGAAPALHVAKAPLAEVSCNQLSRCRCFTRGRRCSSCQTN